MKRIRVAVVNNDVRGLEDIWLPDRVIARLQKCEDLQSIIDTHFDEIRGRLVAWLAIYRGVCPAWLVENPPVEPDGRQRYAPLAFLSAWKQPDRLDRAVRAWARRRFPEDATIFPALATWQEKYQHLADWLMHNRQSAYRHRAYFYTTTAVRLARTSTKLVVENFKIDKVVKRPKPEEALEGGQEARHNRMWAGVSEFRLWLIKAGMKYHCAVECVKAQNNTRRCHVCGELLPWDPAKTVDHDCANCTAHWDQDVNAGNNIHTRVAKGEVVPLVKPAKVAENGESEPAEVRTFSAARKELRKIVKTK
jgi:hypothetical protein